MVRHTYVVVRHGFSLANQSKTIVSDLINGAKECYGLTEEGKAQALASAKTLKEAILKGAVGGAEAHKRNIYVVSSPFSRAVQTASIFLETLAADAKPAAGVAGASSSSSPSSSLKPRILNKDLKPDIGYQLCERNFGEYELLPDTNYPTIWEEDKVSEHKNSKKVEPVASVWARVSNLLNHCEMAITQPAIILLVSHGDTLQITQTAFSGQRLTKHRTLKHLSQAEWRVLPEPCGESAGFCVLRSQPILSKL